MRIPSVLTGEMYGVLADQSDDDPAVHRAGARIDPVGASVSVAKKADREKIVGDSIDLNLEGGKPLLIEPINDMVSGESPIWKHS